MEVDFVWGLTENKDSYLELLFSAHTQLQVESSQFVDHLSGCLALKSPFPWLVFFESQRVAL